MRAEIASTLDRTLAMGSLTLIEAASLGEIVDTVIRRSSTPNRVRTELIRSLLTRVEDALRSDEFDDAAVFAIGDLVRKLADAPYGTHATTTARSVDEFLRVMDRLKHKSKRGGVERVVLELNELLFRLERQNPDGEPARLDALDNSDVRAEGPSDPVTADASSIKLIPVARIARLDEARQHIAREGLEPLLAVAQRFLQSPDKGTSDHVLNRVDANVRVLHGALSDPEGSPLIIEVAAAALLDLLRGSVEVGATVAAELTDLGVARDEAAVIGGQLDEAVELATHLGQEDEAADVAQANAVLAKVEDAAQRIDEALAPVDERARRKDEAKLKGMETWHSAEVPKLKADAIRKLTTGVAAAGIGGAAWATGNLKMAGAGALLTAVINAIKAVFVKA